MFGRIAPRYDLLNHVLSLGIDRRWRRRLLARALASLGPSSDAEAGTLAGRKAIDSCSGTGDLALTLADAGAEVVGFDFTPEMLTRAETKGTQARTRQLAGRVLFAQGVALIVVLLGLSEAFLRLRSKFGGPPDTPSTPSTST